MSLKQASMLRNFIFMSIREDSMQAAYSNYIFLSQVQFSFIWVLPWLQLFHLFLKVIPTTCYIPPSLPQDTMFPWK